MFSVSRNRWEIDLDVSRRQAIGNNAVASKYYMRQAAVLLKGRLRMPPHPTWDFEEPIDWASDPFADRNWCFQFHGLRWLNPLRHAAFEGNIDARSLWIRIVKSWIEGNPVNNPPSKWSWINMAEALRALEITYGLRLVEGETLEMFLTSLAEHGDWLADESHIVGGNHGLHQHQGLFVLGRLFRRGDWTAKAVDRLHDDFALAFDAEGINDEGSLAYHLLNLKWWSLAWRRLDVEGMRKPADAERRLALATAALHHMRKPNGKLEQIGDTDDAGLSRSDIEELNFADQRPARNETDAIFSEGYLFGRSGWGRGARNGSDETFYSLRFGRTDKYHAHDDAGSVTFYSRGVQWISDSGRFSYQTSDPMRKYVRSRKAHNVIDLPEKPRDRGVPVHVIRHASDDAFIDTVLLDRGFGCDLKRRVVYLRDIEALVIVDDLSDAGDLPAAQLWHVPTDVSVSLRGDGAGLASGVKSVSMYWLDQGVESEVVSATDADVVGWLSPSWKSADPGSVISRRFNGGGSTMACVIVPHPELMPPRVHFKTLDDGSLSLEIDTGLETTKVRLFDDAAKVDVTESRRSGVLEFMYSVESELGALRTRTEGG